jgi:hypothetical protein
VSTPIGPSGWHPDPYGRFEYRYHNGVQWTADVAMGGRRFVDPSGAPGSPLQPGTYPMQPPNVPTVSPRTRGLAIASFIVGLVSALIAWMPFLFVAAAVGAVLALVLGILGARKATNHDGHGRGFAIAGISLSVAAALLCVVGFMFTRIVIRELDEYTNPGAHDVEITSCEHTAAELSLTGTIRNLDTVTQDFVVVVVFRMEGVSLHSEWVSVDDVAPGATATFRSATVAFTTGTLTCEVEAVYGPPPFGLELADLQN